MKTATSPSRSHASPSNNALLNPFSKSETEGAKRNSMSVSPTRSPTLMSKKGPIVKTEQKKSQAVDDNEQKVKGKESKRTSLIKRNETYTKKKLEESIEKEALNKVNKTKIKTKAKLSVENGGGKQKNKEKSPSLIRRNDVAKSSLSKNDKEDVKPTNDIETKKPGKNKPSSVSSEQSVSRNKNVTLEKEKEETKLQKTNIQRKNDLDKSSPTSKNKMEVKGKKVKTPKLPPPLSDKEKFDLLFEAYSKWGSDEAATDKGISAYQLTRWLKNVDLLEGKKVYIYTILLLNNE